jgi:hypothetical protein
LGRHSFDHLIGTGRLEIGFGTMDELDLGSDAGLGPTFLHCPTEQCAQQPTVEIPLPIRKVSKSNRDVSFVQISDSLVDDKIEVAFQPDKMFAGSCWICGFPGVSGRSPRKAGGG